MIRTDERIESITQTIVAMLNPRRVVLFGSRARGDAGHDSDYDILVELETSLRPVERALQVERLFRSRDWSLDVIVLTPAEADRMRRDIGTIAYVADQEGQVLYERP